MLLASVVAAAGLPCADTIEQPLVSGGGDPVRGQLIAFGRDGNCLLCHPVADAGRPAGNLAPPLDRVGARLSVGQIGQTLDENAEPHGDGGAALDRGFAGFADTLIWWALAAKAQR